MSLVARLRLSVQNIEHIIQRLTASYFNDQSHHGLIVDTPYTEIKTDEEPSNDSILDEIFSPILYAAPKARRSRERRLTRKFGKHIMERYVQIKKNLMMCLECGHWHEKRTICGNCYERAKAETEEMKNQLGEAMEYTADQKEVVFIYEDEKDNRPKYKGQYIVEMPKPRPKWFSDALMTRVKTSHNQDN